MSKIEKNLEKLYTKNRIVVWYDPDQAFTEKLMDLAIPDVKIITINNDELAVKYKILHQEPLQKFLLYMPYDRPPFEDNWLLDIELSQNLFHTDQESILLQELELPFHLQSWLKTQSVFFKSKERTQKFSLLADKNDSVEILNQKLIQVLIGAERHDLDALLREYSRAHIQDRAETVKENLSKFNLSDFFWESIYQNFKIENTSHNIYDFLLKLFQYSFQPLCGDQVLPIAKVTLSNWKDLVSFADVFNAISNKIANDLQIKNVLKSAVLEDVLEEDIFEVVEQSIVRDLIKKVNNNTYDSTKVEDVINKRISKHWYAKYEAYYQAILSAKQMSENIETIDFNLLKDLESGFDVYTKTFFKIDQYYRKFIYLLRNVSNATLLEDLYDKVEKLYSNKWLLELSEHWQKCIEKNEGWYFGSKSQSQFFNSVVSAQYIDKKRKVFVIISDALRYEIGEELHQKINLQNRFKSKLDYKVTGLPSYTQLGMAALLPNNILTLGDSDDVYIDGLSTKGAAPRAKILNDIGRIKATTISAEELASFKVKSNDAKELVQQHDVVYVYHNIIDKTGDDKVTEEKVFDATHKEIEHLIELTKKISSFNITHIVITADHGFIYQNEDLVESDFADAEISGEIAKSNRRYVIGNNLKHNDSVLKYKASDLEFNSDKEILIPKGMNRLRRQGSGSRFIHGGAMLQEVVVPVLQIVKKREDTIQKVDVDIINKSNNKITTNIHPVRFYQADPVGESLSGRKLKAYFAIDTDKGRQIISDVFIQSFDSTSKRAEDREIKYDFRISTNLYKSDNVFLFIEEQIEGSTQWMPYFDYRFSLRLGMSNDFDF